MRGILKRYIYQSVKDWSLKPDRKPLVLRGARQVGKTLLFLDEIQEAPRAITSLRYFYEEYPDLHVMAAGSLLDFALEDGIATLFPELKRILE